VLLCCCCCWGKQEASIKKHLTMLVEGASAARITGVALAACELSIWSKNSTITMSLALAGSRIQVSSSDIASLREGSASKQPESSLKQQLG